MACGAGAEHSVLVTRSGRAVAFGRSPFGQCAVPELNAEDEDGYVACSAGAMHTVPTHFVLFFRTIFLARRVCPKHGVR